MVRTLKIAYLVVTLCFTAAGAHAQQDSVMQSVTLDSVQIKGSRYTSSLKSRADGRLSIDLKWLGALPKILGNADPMHYSQLLPEIQTNGELRGGVNIQGSESSHNLISIGGVPIYNVCHLLGFFSTFNTPHFDTFSLRRMGDAASANRIGGELTMLLSQTSPDTLGGEFSVGLISSQGTLRWPLSKNTHLTTSFRTSYVNQLYGHWLKIEDMDLAYAFSDFNVTLKHRVNDFHQLMVDYYGGFDKGSFSDQSYAVKMKADWGNQVAGLHHLYHKGDLQLHNTLYLTYYKNRFGLSMEDVGYLLPSRIMDLGLKHQADWKDLSWGAELIYHDIKPQSLQSSGTIALDQTDKYAVQTSELSLFASYNYPVTEELLVACGLRGTLFGLGSSGLQKAIDPSVRVTYRKNEAEFSAGYALKHQFLFQTGFSDAGLPTEFWLSADQRFPAQYAHTVNVGSSLYLFSRRYKAEVNLFYKKLYHQMEYLGSVFDFVNSNYDLTKHLQQGQGENYGLSVILNKCTGKLSGWVSYTYTHANRTFQNRNYTFSPSHERPHELNGVATYSLGRHWDFGGTFVYASGTPFTPVDYLTVVNGQILSHYGHYNAARLKPYVRLDLSVNYKWKCRFAKECGINASVYNVTSRGNELFYYLSSDEDGKFSYRPSSFFIHLLPSISFFCKF